MQSAAAESLNGDWLTDRTTAGQAARVRQLGSYQQPKLLPRTQCVDMSYHELAGGLRVHGLLWSWRALPVDRPLSVG